MEELVPKAEKSKEKNHIEVLLPIKQIFLVGSLLMEFFLFLNISYSCIFTFDCSEFIPTVSYLGCYRGHDRFFCFTMTCWCFYLFFFTLISFLQFESHSKIFNSCFIGTSLVLSVLQPMVAVLDEANTSDKLPLQKIHGFFMIILIVFALFWIYLSSLAIKLHENLKKYIGLGILVTIWSIVQWYYAEKGGIIFNYYLESLSEWAAISMAVFLPYVYSRFYPEVIIVTNFRK